jgi:hypothetical protein
MIVQVTLMKTFSSAFSAVLCILGGSFFVLAASRGMPAEPLRLHPENPRYFEFRGKPTILVTSGEHYGAVLNRDFDFVKYLAALEKYGFNQTRTFSGAYCEPAGAFNIEKNTLAPAAGKLICPWARSDTRGYAGGGNKFDLDRWDDAYFKRLHDFVAEAGRRGIVVELVLFCPFYEDAQWKLSPMNAANNVNGVGHVDRNGAYALKEDKLTRVQHALVVKLVTELNRYDNVYFEICNEPYFGGVTRAWQNGVADLIATTEDKLPRRHLIAENVANKTKKIENPHPKVSVFNFHYATPPQAVATNWNLNRPIGDDETGFRGDGDFAYRSEAWEFLLAGGSEYSNLDYSFTVGHEDGTAKNKAPGGGSHALREQLNILKDFLYGFDFLRMTPAQDVVKGGVPKGGAAYALARKGREYAIYVRGGEITELAIELVAGNYTASWLDTKTGKSLATSDHDHRGGPLKLASPAYQEDIALAVRRR